MTVDQYRNMVVNQMINLLEAEDVGLKKLTAGYLAAQNAHEKVINKWLKTFLFGTPQSEEAYYQSTSYAIFSCNTELWSQPDNMLGVELLLKARNLELRTLMNGLSQNICPGE